MIIPLALQVWLAFCGTAWFRAPSMLRLSPPTLRMEALGL